MRDLGIGNDMLLCAAVFAALSSAAPVLFAPPDGAASLFVLFVSDIMAFTAVACFGAKCFEAFASPSFYTRFASMSGFCAGVCDFMADRSHARRGLRCAPAWNAAEGM